VEVEAEVEAEAEAKVEVEAVAEGRGRPRQRWDCAGRAARSRLEPRNLALERDELLEARAACAPAGRLGRDGRGRGRGGRRAAADLVAQPCELLGQPAPHRASQRAWATGGQRTEHGVLRAACLACAPWAALLVSSLVSSLGSSQGSSLGSSLGGMPAPLGLRGLQLELEPPAQLGRLPKRLLVSPLRGGRPLERSAL
jgi:hypothetical protein